MFGRGRSKAKKEQIIEERYTEIERENRILLEKMTNIMSHRGSLKDSRPYRPKSLNRGLRRRKLAEISMENQAILKRLKEKTSQFNFSKWEKDRKVAENRLKYMCEFPYQLGRNQTPVNYVSSKRVRGVSERPRRSA
jgi:E3 ubiquitin-protein ligase TRIP12